MDMNDAMIDQDSGAAANRYRPIVVALHWITALFVLTQIYLGLTFADMAKGPARSDLLAWHKTVGVVILLLALVRLAVRLINPPPPFPADFPRWERFAAVSSHRLFYGLIIALPLTGLAGVSDDAARGLTDLKFGLQFPVIPVALPDGLHSVLAWGMIGLLVLHVGAALKQQFLDKSAVADRMPPFRRATP